MRVNLPYVFHLTGNRTRRNMDRVIVGDRKAFDIPEVSSDQAPVCISFDRLMDYNLFEKNGSGPHLDVRNSGGRFYRPLLSPLDGNHVVPDDLSRHALVDYGKLHADDLAVAHTAFAAGGSYPRPDFIGETYSDESDISAMLEENANGLLIVDGTVWEACPEPVLIVEEIIGRYCGHYISPAFLDTYDPESKVKYFVFGLDQLEAARTFCERRREHTGIDIETNVCAEVTVLAPELISGDHLADDLLRHAELFLKQAGAVVLNDVSSAYARAHADFHDAATISRLTPEDYNLETLVDSWVSLAEIRAEIDPGGDHGLPLAKSMQDRLGDFPVNVKQIMQKGPRH